MPGRRHLESCAMMRTIAARVRPHQGVRPTRHADRRAARHTQSSTADERGARVALSRTARNLDELAALLKERHARVMEGRPDKSPGRFKTIKNQAGIKVFVAPDQLSCTLARGFELLTSLSDSFHRAVFMMFLVSEVHPFVDGNGRVARIMMNAELVVAGERRIIVPSVFRSNYLSGLKAISQGGITKTLIKSLDFLQRYPLGSDFSTYDRARRQSETTNAFVEGDEGVRPELP
ncbi:MAG: Fic family protein [Polyangiaceae bacterium]